MFRIPSILITVCFAFGLGFPPTADGETNLLLHLPLAVDAIDISRHARPTVINNELQFENGAAWFSGKAVGIGITNLNFADRPFTVSMWIKLTGKNLMYGLIDQKDSKRRSRWLHLMLRGSRQPYLGFYNNDAISPHPIRANHWTHLLFAHDGHHQMIWVNGEPMCARKSKPYRGRSGTLWIGKSPDWSNVPSLDFEGHMKDVRIYQSVLSIAKIKLLSGKPFRQTASLTPSTLPDPETMPKSLNRARDGGVPFLFINGSHLTLTGETSQVYELEGTTDIAGKWEPLGRMTNTIGTIEFDDPGVRQGRQRFYRVRFIGAR
jgi:hypothetical protein